MRGREPEPRASPFYGRIRPWLANPEIKALVKSTKSGAYPPGHTTRVTAVATILSALIPEKRELIWARAAEYAESRVIGGSTTGPTSMPAGVPAQPSPRP